MSRSGYSDEGDQWSMICWRGAVNSAIRGRRGQAFLRDLLASLDSLPAKRLIAHELKSAEGEVCAIGSVGVRRGIEMSTIDPESREQVAETFGIAGALAAELAYVNDEVWYGAETPEKRFKRVRAWVVRQLTEATDK